MEKKPRPKSGNPMTPIQIKRVKIMSSVNESKKEEKIKTNISLINPTRRPLTSKPLQIAEKLIPIKKPIETLKLVSPIQNKVKAVVKKEVSKISDSIEYMIKVVREVKQSSKYNVISENISKGFFPYSLARMRVHLSQIKMSLDRISSKNKFLQFSIKKQYLPILMNFIQTFGHVHKTKLSVSYYSIKPFVSFYINNVDYYYVKGQILSAESTPFFVNTKYHLLSINDDSPDVLDYPPDFIIKKIKYLKLSRHDRTHINKNDYLFPSEIKNSQLETLEMSFNLLLSEEDLLWNDIEGIMGLMHGFTKLKLLIVEFIMEKFSYSNIGRIMKIIKSKKSVFSDFFKKMNINLRFVKTDPKNLYISESYEYCLNKDIVQDVMYPLLICKHSNSSPLRNIHKYVFEKIKGFGIESDYYKSNSPNTGIFSALEVKKKIKK